VTVDEVLANPLVGSVAARLPTNEFFSAKSPLERIVTKQQPAAFHQLAKALTRKLEIRPTLSYNENIGVGVVGGCVETALLMPVLTWKFCLQENRPYPKFPGMYRGVGVLAGSVAPLTGMQMFFNGVFESWATGRTRSPTDVEVVGCALGAGALSAILYAPVEMIAIHQQKLRYSPLQTLSHLARHHGVASIWRGLMPTACREAIYTAGYLGLAPVITAKLMSRNGWEHHYFTSAVLGSCAAGVLANAASHPIDTAKTVLQADVSGTKYTSTWQAMKTLWHESGVQRFYTGGLPRTIRTCGAFFIVSTLREQCIRLKAKQDSGGHK